LSEGAALERKHLERERGCCREKGNSIGHGVLLGRTGARLVPTPRAPHRCSAEIRR
jgi:hypothetical protein